MVRLWQTCKSQPLRRTISNNSVRCSDPQRMTPQQTAAKQPLDGPPNASGLPQRLISKPQRQSVGNKRSRLNLHQVPKPALSRVRITDKEQPEPREINHWLVDASSPEQVLSIYAEHQKRFNIINISTALYRLAKVHLQACLSRLFPLHMVLHEHLFCLYYRGITTGLSVDFVDVEAAKCMMVSAKSRDPIVFALSASTPAKQNNI